MAKVNTTESIFNDSGKTDAEISMERSQEVREIISDATSGGKERIIIPSAIASMLGAVDGIYIFAINGVQCAVKVDGKAHEYPTAVVRHMEKVLESLDKKPNTLPM